MASSDTPDVVGDLAEIVQAALLTHRASATLFCTGCGWIPDDPHAEPDERWVFDSHRREVVGAAIRDAVRAQSPEWVAELIGGRVDEQRFYPAYTDAKAGWLYARAVGPWREVDDRG